MEKLPFVTKEKAEEIAAQFSTPFHLYDAQPLSDKHSAGVRLWL